MHSAGPAARRPARPRSPAIRLRTACCVGTSTLPPRCPHFFSEDSWSSKCTAAQGQGRGRGVRSASETWVAGRGGPWACGAARASPLDSVPGAAPCLLCAHSLSNRNGAFHTGCERGLTASGAGLNQVLGQLVRVQGPAKAGLCRWPRAGRVDVWQGRAMALEAGRRAARCAQRRLRSGLGARPREPRVHSGEGWAKSPPHATCCCAGQALGAAPAGLRAHQPAAPSFSCWRAEALAVCPAAHSPASATMGRK